MNTPPAAPESPLQPAGRETTDEWLDRFEAVAAACKSRREASMIMLAFDLNRVASYFDGIALERVHAAILNLYVRWWVVGGPDLGEPDDLEENNP